MYYYQAAELKIASAPAMQRHAIRLRLSQS